MKEVIIAILVVGFLFISVKIISNKIKEKEMKKEELDAKKRQEAESNRLKEIENILNSLDPFIKSFEDISSYAEIHFYSSRDIFGDCCGIDDTCVKIHYKYKNYSDSFILYFADEKTMKEEITRHFFLTKTEYDLFQNNRIHLENVKSESLEADATSIYCETITGKIIYKSGTNIKEITNYISERFSDVTNFKFYEENINSNRFYIDGFKERKFKIERRIF